MNILLVGYDQVIAAANGSENDLINKIKAQPSWARALPNVFVVKTTYTADAFRTFLNTPPVNKVLVYTVTNELWAAAGVDNDVAQWLMTNWRQV